MYYNAGIKIVSKTSMPNDLHPHQADKKPAEINIWRIAGFVSGTCVCIFAVFLVWLAGFSCKFSGIECHAVTFNFREIFPLIGALAFLGLFILPLVTFPYYWFRLFSRGMLKLSKKSEIDSAESKQKLLQDWRGMFVSSALIVVVLILGYFFHIN